MKTFSPLLGLVVSISLTARATDAPSPAAAPVSAKAPAAPAAPELFKLSTPDLLKQAQTLYDKVEGDYHAHLRDQATDELLLADARKEMADLKIPAPPTTAPNGMKAGVDAAKARQAALAQKVKLAQAQKTLLDRLAAAADGVQSAETASLNGLDDLHAYAVELSLRVADGSIGAEAVPAVFKADALAKKRADLLAARERRVDRATEVVQDQDAATKALEEAKTALLVADAGLTQASTALTQEDTAAQMQKQYAAKPPAEVAAELNALADDGVGLKGTFEMEMAHFNTAVIEADKQLKAVDAANPPEVKIPQLSRPEDVQQAIAGTQQLIDYYEAHAKALESLAAAEASVIKLGGDLAADATVSSEHLFKMRVLAEVLNKDAKTAGTQPATVVKPDRVLAAAQHQSQQMAAVQAAMEQTKAHAPQVDKQLLEARANADTAVTQLARLKESQGGTVATLAWEGKLKTMTAEQATDAFNKDTATLKDKLAAVDKAQATYKAALLVATDLTAKFEGLKDPLLRAAEEAGQADKAKILGDLKKEAGIEHAADAAPATDAKPAAAGDAKAAPPPVVAPLVVEKKPDPAPLEKATGDLQAFQQLVSGRLRVLDDRDAVGKELVAAIVAVEKVDDAYDKSLADARQTEAQLHATAIDLKKRVGRGDLGGDKLPPGISDALKPELQAKLDADTAALLATGSRLKQRRESLQKPDPVAEAARAQTRDVLTLVGKRLDLLADQRRLNADYLLAPKDRDPGEVKRLDQEAAERLDAEAGRFDTLLSIDTSKRATGLAGLLESDYHELVDLELKEDNLRQQRDKMQKLVTLTQTEQDALAKMLPVLDQQVAALEAARDEEVVLAKARLTPERADELLAAFRATTGRQLPKPVPVGEKEKADKATELAGAIFERTVHVAAARDWGAKLAGRLAPTGIKAEAGAYQDEVAKMNATSGANDRRITAITGKVPPEPGSRDAAAVTGRQTFPVAGGSIAKTRGELSAVRRHGVVVILVKIASIILAAILLPMILRPFIRRTMGSRKKDDAHGNNSLVLGAVQAFVKTAVWIVALAMILSVLGFDITAIIAGLGIGGLAIGLAAQPMISDVISSVIIFAERRFTIGDVIKIGAEDPAKVVGLSWRGTQLKGSDGQVVSVPNRNITSATIRNLTKDGRTFDSLSINVSTSKETAKVLEVIKRATDGCKYLVAEHGHSIKEFAHKGDTRVIKYMFWWYLSDYEVRNETRDEVFERISANLGTEDMAGTEVTLA